MRRAVILLLAAIVGVSCSWAQQAGTSPQSARQALIEMFFSKTPGTFVKHLPVATRAALEKSGALDSLQQYSMIASQIETHGVQTFETGAVLLSFEDPKTGQKSDITVEKESLHGDVDDIEVTFHVSKNGQEQRTPFLPQLTFSMKQEGEVWKLNEISFTLHLPLADPDFLKAITEKMQHPQIETNTTFTPHSGPVAQIAGSDGMVLAAMRRILNAEGTYASTYWNVGYTCTLSSLDGFGGGEPNEHQAMLISSGLASGKKYGYVFTLTGCAGAPATAFHLIAAPNANTFGRKAFCADQSGTIRSSDDGNAETCLAHGTPVAEPTGIAKGTATPR